MWPSPYILPYGGQDEEEYVETKPRTNTSIDAITVIVLQPSRDFDQPNNPLHSDIRFIPGSKCHEWITIVRRPRPLQ
jgi:hypothetical protein